MGDGPVAVAVNPDGTRAYVTNRTSNTVSVIDTAADTGGHYRGGIQSHRRETTVARRCVAGPVRELSDEAREIQSCS